MVSSEQSATETDRIIKAYLEMARLGYRPAAPGDGFGNVDLSNRELRDRDRLLLEARRYASDFIEEEDSQKFFIGVSCYPNSELVYAIEIARLLCAGRPARGLAVRLLKVLLHSLVSNSPEDHEA